MHHKADRLGAAKSAHARLSKQLQAKEKAIKLLQDRHLILADKLVASLAREAALKEELKAAKKLQTKPKAKKKAAAKE